MAEDELAAMRRANEEKMARLRALEEADAASAPAAQRVVSTLRRGEAAAPAPATVPAAASAVPARMGALPARMGALPARMAAVKPLMPASAASVTASVGGKLAATHAPATAAPSPPPSAASPISPPSPPATRSAFGMRSNTFNASDLFGSSDDDEPPPPRHYTTGGLATHDEASDGESVSLSESVSPFKASPGRASVSSSIDLTELRRRADELDRQTAQRAAERAREAERIGQEREERRRAAEAAAEGRESDARAVEAARRRREQEEKERAREASEMIQSAGVACGAGRLTVQTPASNGTTFSPTHAAPRLVAPSACAPAPDARRSQHGWPCVDATTQTEAALDGTGAWGAMHGLRMAGTALPPFFVPVPVGMGAPQAYAGPPPGYAMGFSGYAAPPPGYAMGFSGYAAPPPGYAMGFSGYAATPPGYAVVPSGYAGVPLGGPWAPYGPAAPPYGYSAALPLPGVPGAGLSGPHIPIAKVIGILPPADGHPAAVGAASLARGVPTAAAG